MLTLNCDVGARARLTTGGFSYDLVVLCLKQLHPSLEEPKTLDTDRVHISIYDFAASIPALENRRYDPPSIVTAEQSGMILALRTVGSLELEVFVGEKDQACFDDLDEALKSPHLFVRLSLDREFGISDQLTVKSWLEGKRFDADHIAQGSAAPQQSLVVQR
jgi:hypothetical protein